MLLSHKRVNQKLAWAKSVKIMSGMEKVNEAVVFSVSSSVRMEEGRKPKEAVGERFKTQGLSHYPTEPGEESCRKALGIEQAIERVDGKKILGKRKPISGSRSLWAMEPQLGKHFGEV